MEKNSTFKYIIYGIIVSVFIFSAGYGFGFARVKRNSSELEQQLQQRIEEQTRKYNEQARKCEQLERTIETINSRTDVCIGIVRQLRSNDQELVGTTGAIIQELRRRITAYEAGSAEIESNLRGIKESSSVE